MQLLFLSKYLAYAFVFGSFTHNGKGGPVTLHKYLIKYLHESFLPYDFSFDNSILLISTSLILTDVSCI